ncbi:MAG: bifunctional DNA primase/polymerase [Streptomycetales bacterium]
MTQHTAAQPALFRVLVTGSRNWRQPHIITDALDGLRAAHRGRLVVVHGACPQGADQVADTWCRQVGVAVEPHPADWATHGRAAGPIRNTAMVTAGAELCLAFITNHSPGATGCANTAQTAGIPTTRHHDPQETTPVTTNTTRPELLTAALDYAARGWHVFPLRPGEKRPAFPDHDAGHCTRADPRCRQGHLGWEPRATTDPHRIRAAWTTAPFNIGIATGPSRLVVVDLDTPKPDQQPPEQWRIDGLVDGRDTFALVCERAGQPMPVNTYTVTTGRGGTHLYFTHPDGAQLRNTTRTLGWLIDTRAHGGYVVAPPSIVNHRPYTLAHNADPAPLPDWLTHRLQPTPLPPQQPVAVPLASDRLNAYLRAAVNAQLEYVTSATEGDRNNALFRGAIALGQLVAGGALRESDVTAWLTGAAAHTGLAPGEAARTIASGLRAGAKRPREVAA